MNKFGISLKDISLGQFKNILKTKRLMPGRIIFLEDIDGRLEILRLCSGISWAEQTKLFCATTRQKTQTSRLKRDGEAF